MFPKIVFFVFLCTFIIHNEIDGQHYSHVGQSGKKDLEEIRKPLSDIIKTYTTTRQLDDSSGNTATDKANAPSNLPELLNLLKGIPMSIHIEFNNSPHASFSLIKLSPDSIVPHITPERIPEMAPVNTPGIITVKNTESDVKDEHVPLKKLSDTVYV